MLKFFAVMQLALIVLVFMQSRENWREILVNRQIAFGIKEKVETMWKQRADGVTNKELKSSETEAP